MVYWNTILQILRSSHDEFKAAMQQTIQAYDNIVFNIVYNSLSCVLFAMRPNTDDVLKMANGHVNGDDDDGGVHMNGTNGTEFNSMAEWKIGWLQNGDFDCDNNILFRKKVMPIENGPTIVNGTNGVVPLTNGHSEHSDVNGEPDVAISDNVVCNAHLDHLLNNVKNMDVPNGVLYIQDDISFHRIIEATDDSVNVPSTNGDCDMSNGFDNENAQIYHVPVKTNQLTNGTCDTNMKPATVQTNLFELDQEPSLIYRVKNAKANAMNDSAHSLNGNVVENGVFKNSVGNVKPALGDQNDNEANTFFNGVQKINEFISRNVIKILVSAASASLGNGHNIHLNGSDASDIDDKVDDDDVPVGIPQFFSKDELLLVHSSDHKKLLMQLFEIALGVMMCNTHVDNAGKFSMYSYFFLISIKRIECGCLWGLEYGQ